jgi:hypothetical protein
MATRTPKSGDALGAYFGLRGKYLAQLEERGFLDRSGRLTAAVVDGVFQPPPGGEAEWEKHCREHPRDPLCLLGARADVRIDELFEVRDDYLDSIEEAGLVDVQRGISDMVASGVSFGGGVGIPTPDDPDGVPDNPIIGPLVREFAARMLF